jgi:hypothetical protein
MGIQNASHKKIYCGMKWCVTNWWGFLMMVMESQDLLIAEYFSG